MHLFVEFVLKLGLVSSPVLVVSLVVDAVGHFYEFHHPNTSNFVMFGLNKPNWDDMLAFNFFPFHKKQKYLFCFNASSRDQLQTIIVDRVKKHMVLLVEWYFATEVTVPSCKKGKIIAKYFELYFTVHHQWLE